MTPGFMYCSISINTSSRMRSGKIVRESSTDASTVTRFAVRHNLICWVERAVLWEGWVELATAAAALYGTAENLLSFLLVSSLRPPAVRPHRVRLATETGHSWSQIMILCHLHKKT